MNGLVFDLQRFAGERTMPATPRRRRRARQQGQVGHSADLVSALSFLAAAVTVARVGPRMVGSFALWAAMLWTEGNTAFVQVGPLPLLGQGGRIAGMAVITIGAVAAGVAILAGVAQTGFVLTAQGLTPQFSRINPLSGVQRLFSRQALVELGKSLLKLGAIALTAYGPVLVLFRKLEADNGVGALPVLGGDALHTIATVLYRAAAVFLVVGALDFAFQRWSTEQSLRMTRLEFQDEVKEEEGDPALRARRRRRQRELARRRMLADVRHADVVLTNPTHVAVALRYDQATMSAPVVLAKGSGSMAERIRAVARSAGVMIVENPPLARALHAAVPLGQRIPTELYKAVAEVLAFVWRVRGRV